MNVKKLIIVDDHKIVRDGLKAILIGNPDYTIIQEVGSGEELIEALQSQSPDLVILDIELPDISGLELISIIKQQGNAKILMLTADMGEDVVCDAVQNGADGFLNKNSSSEELIYAIGTVLDGEPYFGMNLSTLIHRSFTKKVREYADIDIKPDLSDREMEVLKSLADGLSFKVIAEKLNISPRTVESHKNNILQKLDLKNTIELLKYALKHKLVE